ncbi:hypothetical protein HDV06_000383 [Boothiomyces sp. JEL0866]|nr:hypothetical protein HDV06_000383 [Boothiomyces sp. JEL0866]
MQTYDIIKYGLTSLIVLVLLACCLLIVPVLSTNMIPKQFRMIFMALIVIVVATGCINLNQIFNHNSYMDRVGTVLAHLTLYIGNLFDVGILGVFSVLNQKITPFRINLWVAVITLVYLAAGSGEIIKLFYGDTFPAILAPMNNYGGIALSVFTIFYDNIQTAYLARLIFATKSKRSLETFGILRKLIINMVLLSIGDWFAVLVFAYAIFSVLNENITENKIRVWTGVVTLLYLGCSVWEIAKLFYGDKVPTILTTMNNIGTDNLQTLYLISLIYRSKKKRGAKTQSIHKELVVIMAFISVCDWFGILLYAYAVRLGQSNGLYLYICMAVETYTQIHGLMMIIIFKKLKELTFVDRASPKKIYNFTPPTLKTSKLV